MLNDQIKTLLSWIKEKHPGNRELIRDYISEKFNMSYTISAISRLLKRHGITRIKPKLIPGKPPTLSEQYEFLMSYCFLKNLCATHEKIVQLFVDGMHLIHQVIPTYYWGNKGDRITINTNSSRNRLNILGAYNVDTCHLTHLTSENNCNANQVIQFLELICKEYRNKELIVLYMDNARYFRAVKVREWLEDHSQISIRFLPPYAPNLNLIERLWRFVKGKLVRNRYYKEYKIFRANTFRLLNHLEGYTQELKSLINNNFEIIKQD